MVSLSLALSVVFGLIWAGTASANHQWKTGLSGTCHLSGTDLYSPAYQRADPLNSVQFVSEVATGCTGGDFGENNEQITGGIVSVIPPVTFTPSQQCGVPNFTYGANTATQSLPNLHVKIRWLTASGALVPDSVATLVGGTDTWTGTVATPSPGLLPTATEAWTYTGETGVSGSFMTPASNLALVTSHFDVTGYTAVGASAAIPDEAGVAAACAGAGLASETFSGTLTLP
jgi:hypothetical protein